MHCTKLHVKNINIKVSKSEHKREQYKGVNVKLQKRAA
jgi:hypothetical protein